MANTKHVQEAQAFSERFRRALENAGIRPSPTRVANEFNLRYWGTGVTSHAVRNWLLGNSMPKQDKLVVLAEWLQISPEELRYGVVEGAGKNPESEHGHAAMALQDREMLRRYLSLSPDERKVVREVVTALFTAGQLKRQR